MYLKKKKSFISLVVLFFSSFLVCRAAAVAVAQVQQMNDQREIKEHANFFLNNIESPSLNKSFKYLTHY
jgi:hypothetical protein